MKHNYSSERKETIAYNIIKGLLLLLILSSCTTNHKPDFIFNVKGLTAQDRAQWEKDNIEELNKLGYNNFDDNRKNIIFKNSSFKNKFGNRPDYNSLKVMSPEQRDSLFYASPDENVESLTEYNHFTINSTLHMEYLNVEGFYCKSALISACGIIFIWILGKLARRSSLQVLTFSKKQKIIGSILMLIGTFSFLLGIIMIISGSYSHNELTELGYSISNAYNDSIIRPSNMKLVWGYNNPFQHSIFSMLYGGICLLAWGNYIKNYQKSTVTAWRKVCKVVGYILLTTTFWNCSEFHYFDIWEFMPKFMSLGLSVLLISIGYEKIAENKEEVVSPSDDKPEKGYKGVWTNRKVQVPWTNKKAQALYKYIYYVSAVTIVLGLIIFFCILDEDPAFIFFWLAVEALVKNMLLLIYLKKKAKQEYSEDYLIPHWFKSKFYCYMKSKAGVRVIMLLLFFPLFYIVPLPLGTYAIVFYILPISLLIALYFAFMWIKLGSNEPIYDKKHEEE